MWVLNRSFSFNSYFEDLSYILFTIMLLTVINTTNLVHFVIIKIRWSHARILCLTTKILNMYIAWPITSKMELRIIIIILPVWFDKIKTKLMFGLNFILIGFLSYNHFKNFLLLYNFIKYRIRYLNDTITFFKYFVHLEQFSKVTNVNSVWVSRNLFKLKLIKVTILSFKFGYFAESS